MKPLLSILLICSIGLTQELTVDGNLNVTGNIQNQTIDSLKQVIADLQAQMKPSKIIINSSDSELSQCGTYSQDWGQFIYEHEFVFNIPSHDVYNLMILDIAAKVGELNLDYPNERGYIYLYAQNQNQEWTLLYSEGISYDNSYSDRQEWMYPKTYYGPSQFEKDNGANFKVKIAWRNQNSCVGPWLKSIKIIGIQ